MPFLREYGAATTIFFPLITSGSTQFTSGSAGYTPVAGDVKISKDGGASANTTNLPAYIGMGNGVMWSLSMAAAEMYAKTIIVTVIDAAPKAVEDQMLVIETYSSSGSTGQLDLNDWADALLGRNMASVSVVANRSPLNALRFLRNKWSTSGSTLTVYKEDDVTSAWTAGLTTSGSASPIVGSAVT